MSEQGTGCVMCGAWRASPWHAPGTAIESTRVVHEHRTMPQLEQLDSPA